MSDRPTLPLALTTEERANIETHRAATVRLLNSYPASPNWNEERTRALALIARYDAMLEEANKYPTLF